MEQAQVQAIEGIKRSLKALIVEAVPMNDYEWGALFKLGQALRDIRSIDPSKLGQAVLPGMGEPGAKQLPLTPGTAVEHGEDSLNENASREERQLEAQAGLKAVGDIVRAQAANKDGDLQFPDTAKGADGKPKSNVDIEQCVNCGETFKRADIKDVDKCPSCLLPYAALQPTDVIVQAQIDRDMHQQAADDAARKKAGQVQEWPTKPCSVCGSTTHGDLWHVDADRVTAEAIQGAKLIHCPLCASDFEEKDLTINEGVQECPKCHTALLGDKPAGKPKRIHKKSKAKVA